MHGIEELMNILGYDKPHKVRERMDILKPVLDPYLKRGPKNKVLVESSGLEILKRAKQLEDSGFVLKDTLKLLQEELKSSGGERQTQQPETATNGGSDSLIHEKEKQIELLKSEVQFLRDRLMNFESILHNRLPPPKESSNGNGSQKPGRWMRLRQLLKGE